MSIGPIGPRRDSGRSPFDAIRQVHENPDGTIIEQWSAREAMPHLGYATWHNMQNVLKRARSACRNSGHSVPEHFTDISKMRPQGGPRQRDTIMTRFGMYLLAMNGDPDKPEIAAAQRYFAMRTYQAEQMAASPTPPEPPPPAAPLALPHRPWAERFRLTFMPHARDIHQRNPGCFSVVSAAVAEIMFIEEELIRHMMTTRGFDRPDISIGKRYAVYRRGRSLPEPTRSAKLCLLEQGIDVDVRVYEGAEWPIFTAWFRGPYLSEHLGYYLNHKDELRPYPQLSRHSVADNACLLLSGQPAVLPPGMRAALNAAGGFAPAPPLPPQIGPGGSA